MKLKGTYTFEIPITTMFINTKLKIYGENLITLFGASFFMHRWIDNEFEPLKYLVLGKGTKRPLITDESLGSETCRKLCKTNVNLNTKTLELSATFTAKEILNTTEIGVANDKILISHDLYTTLSEDVIGELTTTINLTYNFHLDTGSLRTQWKKSTQHTNLYYVYEPTKVTGVIEYNTNSGYVRKNSIEEVVNNKGSYYYETTTKNLYVRTSDDTHPDNNEIIIQTK